MNQKHIVSTLDIVGILGVNKRSAQRLLRKIKIHYEKDFRQWITVDEFAHYTGISIDVVESAINSRN